MILLSKEEKRMKDLKDKNAIVTGSASGIGRAVALELAGEGANIVIADLNEPEMDEAAEQIRALGVKAIIKKTDVSSKDQVKELIDYTIDEFGSLDLLVNNAGVVVMGEMRDMRIEDEWEWIMGINLWGPIYGCHYSLPHMVKRGSGHIVNIASAAGFFAAPGVGAYCTTKFGVVGMTEALRSEVARFGVGVTCVCPGLVKTSIFKSSVNIGAVPKNQNRLFKLRGQSPERIAKRIVRGIKRNKPMLVPTIDAKAMYLLKRFFPRIYSWVGIQNAKN